MKNYKVGDIVYTVNHSNNGYDIQVWQVKWVNSQNSHYDLINPLLAAYSGTEYIEANVYKLDIYSTKDEAKKALLSILSNKMDNNFKLMIEYYEEEGKEFFKKVVSTEKKSDFIGDILRKVEEEK